MSVTAKNFYRRSLPSTCVDFSSEEGKRLFKESLLEGNANIYFKLAAQFRTQDEPAYCGLSTLGNDGIERLGGGSRSNLEGTVEILSRNNARLLCSIRTREKVVFFRTGINLPQFTCLASCNRLNADVRYGKEGEDFLRMLREDVIASVRNDAEVIVASYDRSQLEQTGTGHFSPLAAFHSGTDKVLIMDVARFKYPPHWVTLTQLQQAMCSLDPSTKKTRGYVKLSLRKDSCPLVAFAIKANLGCNDADVSCLSIISVEHISCTSGTLRKEMRLRFYI
ncbi:glutathione gamma-glutamylcysteinyltransferase domain protein [Necator americanus]|uniref:glutathione gamma-glutamylcysteinyltransferase n=1 Tax=Necator americanus TaxID=51031 RepID=W2TN02_NECAM|nr:glutathione gamma-glutamylcysteinyltransferase domain protein [Necator americanus]ETN83044.1 glutathione gamma-glutamylcysteinyltransferase domain protein [Necator americanus]